MLRIIVLAASVASAPTLAVALAPPASCAVQSSIAPAAQSVDPCYKKCFLDAKGKNGAWKSRCSRSCNASPKKKCEDKCWLKFGNDPNGRKKCLSRCS